MISGHFSEMIGIIFYPSGGQRLLGEQNMVKAGSSKEYNKGSLIKLGWKKWGHGIN